MFKRANAPVSVVMTAMVGLGSAMAGATSLDASSDARARPAEADGDALPSSAKDRDALARRFTETWGAYVTRVYQVPAEVWAERMAPNLAAADAVNLRRALKRETFEGAMSELAGMGHRWSDSQVIDLLAQAAPDESKGGTPSALGSLNRDLVYTPLTPCRIVDTRVAGGVIPSNSSRSFTAVNSVSFTSQGGSATNCGTLGLSASAVAMNVTVVTPSAAGYATVYPFGASQPFSSSVNYTAGAIVNNAIISAIPNPLQSSDITLFTFAQAHYVIDIVGYFAPPEATQLDCVNTSVSNFDIAANTVNFFNNPACPAGYRATTPYCWTAASGVYQQGSGYNANAPGNATFCSWQNTTASSQTVFGGNVCCRIPGR